MIGTPISDMQKLPKKKLTGHSSVKMAKSQLFPNSTDLADKKGHNKKQRRKNRIMDEIRFQSRKRNR